MKQTEKNSDNNNNKMEEGSNITNLTNFQLLSYLKIS